MWDCSVRAWVRRRAGRRVHMPTWLPRAIAGISAISIVLLVLSPPHSLPKLTPSVRRSPAPPPLPLPSNWTAVGSADATSQPTPFVCSSCVMDPLDYPDTYCSPTPALRFNGTHDVRPSLDELEALERIARPTATSLSEVTRFISAGMQRPPVIGVLGDSFMEQALGAMACDLRRSGHPEHAAFMRWETVAMQSGQHNEGQKHLRYNWAGPHGGRDDPRWFVLDQMFYNKKEVQKVVTASDVVIINYGLHYCQPVRPGADARCWEKYRQHGAELEELFTTLQAHASQPGKVAIFQETSAQHFAQAGPNTPPAELARIEAQSQVGDWETRYFFPRLGPQQLRPPGRCHCVKTSQAAATAHVTPMRTELVRNISRRYPAVRVLPLYELTAPRHQWHQQDCREQSQVLLGRRVSGADRGGCDCTHYCYSPAFWRTYFAALLRELQAAASGR